MAKLSAQEIIDALKEMSVIELNDLVKAVEDEFGVSAAAGVVVAGPAAAAPAEEKTEFNVELTDIGPNKVKVINAADQAKQRVDVYSVDGKLLKRNVKVSEAQKGLSKGIYIIGKEKVSVR